MKGFVLAALAIAATCVSGQEYTRCGTTEVPEVLAFEVDEEEVLETRSRRIARFEVDTYVHVITTEAKKDLYPKSMVEEQMRIMNSAFASSRFSYKTKSINYYVNDTWAKADYGPVELEYKAAIRKGSYDDLNLYFLSDLGRGLLGFCTFPQENITDLVRVRDGCVNLAGSMPGGETPRYNLGATAVHETGHWLGLFHTFSANCTGDGDFVKDTPFQSRPTSGCPLDNRPDTCPGQKGLDPITNYMDYSTDICMDEFTKGQSHRMLKMFRQLRSGRK